MTGASPRATVVTVSTRAAAEVYPDATGPAVAAELREAGFDVGDVVVVPDGREIVASTLRRACATAQLIVTTGGTGLHPSDETPEATLDVAERVVPGLAEAMRADGRSATPLASLSRGVAAIAGGALIVNLPGSPKGAVENLRTVLPVLGHALEQLAGGDHRRS